MNADTRHTLILLADTERERVVSIVLGEAAAAHSCDQNSYLMQCRETLSKSHAA